MTDFAACAPGRLLHGLDHRAGRTGDWLGHTLQSAFSLLGLTHCHLVKEKPNSTISRSRAVLVAIEWSAACSLDDNARQLNSMSICKLSAQCAVQITLKESSRRYLAVPGTRFGMSFCSFKSLILIECLLTRSENDDR